MSTSELGAVHVQAQAHGAGGVGGRRGARNAARVSTTARPMAALCDAISSSDIALSAARTSAPVAFLRARRASSSSGRRVAIVADATRRCARGRERRERGGGADRVGEKDEARPDVDATGGGANQPRRAQHARGRPERARRGVRFCEGKLTRVG